MKRDSTKNYFRFTDFSLIYRHYAYVDVASYYADDFLRRRKVHIVFGKELTHSDHEYKLILCKVPKWQEKQFVLAMAELKDKMLICGHTDYVDVCKSISDIIKK